MSPFSRRETEARKGDCLSEPGFPHLENGAKATASKGWVWQVQGLALGGWGWGRAEEARSRSQMGSCRPSPWPAGPCRRQKPKPCCIIDGCRAA